MNSMSLTEILSIIGPETVNTLIMVIVSTVLGYVFGIPLPFHSIYYLIGMDSSIHKSYRPYNIRCSWGDCSINSIGYSFYCPHD